MADEYCVAVLVYPGFDELDAVAPYEVFSKAAQEGAELTTYLATTEPVDSVTASHGTRLAPQALLGDLDPGAVVVPGGGWNDRSDTGAYREAEKGLLPRELKRLHDKGVLVTSVCTGALLLAEAGLLDGRPATTHHSAIDDLEKYGVDVREARVVDDADVVTGGGVTSGIDVALHLVERLWGAGVADRVAERMEYERSHDEAG